jgi:predicted metal-dependent phosphoesterase TrpH
MRIDLHTHSTVSDGTDQPAELVRAASAAGLDVIALTDHDTFDGLEEAHTVASGLGLGFLAGMEMSTERDGRSVHVLGYGCHPDAAALSAELRRVRAGRDGRLPAMLAKLAELGMPLTPAEVRAQAGESPSLGRPHVADAMVARGYVSDRDEAFARWLGDDGPAYVDRYATPVERAIDLIHGAGGAAVIAHPWGRGRRADLPEAFLALLVDVHGLEGIEVDHPDHDAATRAELREVAGRLGVLATGSSDYHGNCKTTNPLGCDTTEEGVFGALVARIAARGGRPMLLACEAASRDARGGVQGSENHE